MKRRTLISLIPVFVLVALLAFDITVFGSDSISGASQVALLVAAGVCVWLATWQFKTPWSAIEEALQQNIGSVTIAILILLLIGAISGTWTVSGVIPTLIYYGVQIISPKFFLLTACAVCAVVSVMIGSSWTTIATIGVALMGIGRAEGFSEGLIAGAIISGAYFGDKVSPLSDTTIMASTVSGAPLFTHIRYMMITTVPAFLLALAIFTFLGFTHSGDPAEMSLFTETLAAKFHLSLWLLLVPLATGVMIFFRMPALAVLGLSALLAAVFAVIFQPDIVLGIGRGALSAHIPAGPHEDVWAMLTGIVETFYNSVSIDTGVEEVNSLVASRGMLGMLNTVYLIICATSFGACMRAGGMLSYLAEALKPLTRTRTGLVATTVGTGTVLNALVCDQYLAIILTSNLYRDTYEKQGYENRLLSRTIEDAATVTSPLVPWGSCGMTQSTVLGVSTLAYTPFCFFNIISPLMSIVIAGLGYKIYRHTPDSGETSA